MVLAVCVAAVAADFVGLNPEQLARVGRQQEEAVQVRVRTWNIFEMGSNKFHSVRYPLMVAQWLDHQPSKRSWV